MFGPLIRLLAVHHINDCIALIIITHQSPTTSAPAHFVENDSFGISGEGVGSES